jgi:hypothetical protein
MKNIFRIINIFNIFISLTFLSSDRFEDIYCRERVQIKNGTLVTDRGTLLRGAYFSADGKISYLPSRKYITNIKKLGLNCIHVYAECPEFQKPGDKSELIDNLVKWTGDESLYLILTIGGCSRNGQFDLKFVKDFWNFYAPRYKDKTHVIYEICNEPFQWTAPYDAGTIDMEKTVYDIGVHSPKPV